MRDRLGESRSRPLVDDHCDPTGGFIFACCRWTAAQRLKFFLFFWKPLIDLICLIGGNKNPGGISVLKKRIYAGILAVFLLLALAMAGECLAAGSAETYAADDEAAANNFAAEVKDKISLPPEYSELSFDIKPATGKTGKRYYFHWRSGDGRSEIFAETDAQGNVLSYGRTRGALGSQPLGSEKLRENAESFLKALDPQLFKQLKPEDSDNTGYFQYFRVANGLPYYEDSIIVACDETTGQVDFYRRIGDWSELGFSGTNGIISAESARKQFMDKIGLKLIYDYILLGDKYKAFPVYSVVSRDFCINALTGSKTTAVHLLEDTLYDDDYGTLKARSLRTGSQIIFVGLRPAAEKMEERPEIQIGLGKAVEIAKGVKPALLTDSFKLKKWYISDTLDWNLKFENPGKESYYFVIDSITGDVAAFFTDINVYDQGGNTGKELDESSIKRLVDESLKGIPGLKTEEIEYLGCFKYFKGIPEDSSTVCDYNFKYVRKVNGIPFPANDLDVVYSVKNEKIVSFYKKWFDVDFEPVGKVLPVEKIYDVFFEKAGLELRYINALDMIGKKQDEKSGVVPAYCLKRGMPALFEARTGIMLDYNGEPFRGK